MTEEKQMPVVYTVTAHDFDADVHAVVGTLPDYDSAYKVVELYLLHEIEEEGVSIGRDNDSESFTDENCFVLKYADGSNYDEVVLSITVSPMDAYIVDPSSFYNTCETVRELREEERDLDSGEGDDYTLVLVALP